VSDLELILKILREKVQSDAGIPVDSREGQRLTKVVNKWKTPDPTSKIKRLVPKVELTPDAKRAGNVIRGDKVMRLTPEEKLDQTKNRVVGSRNRKSDTKYDNMMKSIGAPGHQEGQLGKAGSDTNAKERGKRKKKLLQAKQDTLRNI